MRWQTPVGRAVACIGLLFVAWGLIGMLNLIRQSMSETIMMSGIVLVIGGLFLSLFGLGKNFSKL
jgi:hypothetical protein